MSARRPLRKRLFYAALSRVPGRIGAAHARRLEKLMRPTEADMDARLDAALAAAGPGLCVDLGANVGRYARRMALTGRPTAAFEPDPWTARELRGALADLPNAEVVEAAAWIEEGEMELHRAPGFEEARRKQSQSSSLMSEKSNLAGGDAIHVRTLDFAAWLEARPEASVALVKIDVEGAEVPLLERLMDHPVLARIERVFVETHEDRLPALAARTEALRRRAAALTRPVMEFDWK